MSDDSAPIRELVEQALRTRDERTRVMVERCVAMLPYYRELPEAALGTTRESVHHHQALFYEVTLAEGRPLVDADLEYSRGIARVAAGAGVPLGEFLTFFDEGVAIMVEELMEKARDDRVREALLGRLERILRNQTQLMTSLTEAYVRERERLSHFREQDLQGFFELLLQPEGGEDELAQQAEALGIDLEERHSVVLFRLPASPSADAASARLEQLRSRLAGALPGGAGVAGRVREGVAALVPGDLPPDRLRSVTETLRARGTAIGIGRAGEGIAALRQSASEARRALRIGALLGDGTLQHYEEVEVLDLVGVGSAGARRFMRGVLGALAESGAHTAHLETLHQLARHDFVVTRAAQALAVHPNTISYRLEQIRSRYGIDVEAPHARLRIGLALLIRAAIHPGPGPA